MGDLEAVGSRLYKVKDVADEHGIPLSTIYDALARRQLGHVRLGRAIRIPDRELRAWLERLFVAPVIEPEPAPLAPASRAPRPIQRRRRAAAG